MDRRRSYLARVTEVEVTALVETGYEDHYNISFDYELSFAEPHAVFSSGTQCQGVLMSLKYGRRCSAVVAA